MNNNIDQLSEHLDVGTELSDGFLDPETGEIFRITEFNRDEDDLARIGMRQLILLPNISSQDTYLWMVDFAEDVQDAVLREKMRVALKGVGAVWKFRNILYHHPTESQAWDAFRKRKLVEIAKEWLASERF